MKVCQEDAPSSDAASARIGSVRCKAVKKMTSGKPTWNQIIMPMIDRSAVPGSPNQSWAIPPSPTACRKELKAPSGARIQPQTTPATATGMTWGR